MAVLGFGVKFYLHNGTSLLLIGEVIDINLPAITRAIVETTSHDSASRTREFMSGLIDPGEMDVTFNVDPGSAADLAMTAAVFATAAKATKIVIPRPPSGTWEYTFNAFATNYRRSSPLEDRLTSTISLKVSGAITEATGA